MWWVLLLFNKFEKENWISCFIFPTQSMYTLYILHVYLDPSNQVDIIKYDTTQLHKNGKKCPTEIPIQVAYCECEIKTNPRRMLRHTRKSQQFQRVEGFSARSCDCAGSVAAAPAASRQSASRGSRAPTTARDPFSRRQRVMSERAWSHDYHYLTVTAQVINITVKTGELCLLRLNYGSVLSGCTFFNRSLP